MARHALASIRQLLTESLLLALAAAALGFAISRLVLEATIYAVTSTMAPDLGDVRLNVPAADWRVALFLVGGAMVSTVFFGLAPALQATRLELVRTIRGEVTRDSRPGRSRSVLIGIQVTASALLLICAGVFLRSALASATVDPGIRTADTVIVEIINEQTRSAMIQAVDGRAVGRRSRGIVARHAQPAARRLRRSPHLRRCFHLRQGYGGQDGGQA